MDTTCLESFEELLDEFKKLPDRVERPPTFMEIAGYPHYENACSNILAFFMDPEESHGLGTLMLDALANAGRIVDADEGFGGNIAVEREVSTEAGNRIDLLIESDDRAVLIENKIYANVSNPFADYTDYLDRRITDGRAKHKLLLTVFPTDEGRTWEFANLTYAKFVEEMRSLLGNYVSSADTRYLTIFLDFLNTLGNLQRGTRMDQEFIKFLAERDDDIKKLFNDLKSFRADMRKKIEELRDLVEWNQYPSIEKEGLWRADTVGMFDNLFHHIRITEDLLVGVDTHLDPHGWEIQIYPRDKGDPTKLTSLLESLGISFEDSRGWRLYAHPARFAYDENLDQIRPVLQEIVDKLATYRGP